MATREALRQAIMDLERLAGGLPMERAPTLSVLARLYTTYAQATLEEMWIDIDLPQVCGDHLIINQLINQRGEDLQAAPG